jgi:hypothetical protein
MKNRWAKRRQLRELLVIQTGCGSSDGDWPCGVCFRAMTLPGVSADALDVMWEAALVLRGGGYTSEDLSEGQVTQVIDRLIEKLTEAQQVH